MSSYTVFKIWCTVKSGNFLSGYSMQFNYLVPSNLFFKVNTWLCTLKHNWPPNQLFLADKQFKEGLILLSIYAVIILAVSASYLKYTFFISSSSGKKSELHLNFNQPFAVMWHVMFAGTCDVGWTATEGYRSNWV